MEPMLRPGQIIPTFTLPDSEGRPLRRTIYRGQKHLVLVFLSSIEDHGGRAYLQALADTYRVVRDASAAVLAIVRGVEVSAQAFKREIDLPFPLLLDADGHVAAQFLPPAAPAAIFMTDRYGELYYSRVVATTTDLPPIGELHDWLTAIDNQCAI
jgi:peroxiredoxin